MSRTLKLEFQSPDTSPEDVLVLFCEEGMKLGKWVRRIVEPVDDLVRRAATADNFKGKNGSVLEIVAPSGLDIARMILIGVGKAGELKT